MNTAINKTQSVPAMYAAQLAEERSALFQSPSTSEETIPLIKRHALMLDQYFQSCFESSAVGPEMDFIRNPYAIVALGGYGRSEQCVHSDVDLLFVFQKRVPSAAEALIREMVYPLWDLKMEVGYATRSVDECVAMAKDDYEILTSILDARFVCGSSSVFSKLRDQVNSRIVSRYSKKLISWLLERNEKRHQDFGDSTFLLQPNLKEGKGGLRDYHTLRWMAGATHDVKEIRDLEYQGVMSFQEYQDLHTALSFIWNVRNKLHLLVKRKCDQLYFEYQRPLAEAMGYIDEKTQTAVERFLGDLHSHMTFIKNQLQLFLYESGDGRKRKWFQAGGKISRVPGIILDNGRLNFTSPEVIVANPELLIHIFELSAQMKTPLSREAVRLVREFSYLVDEGFRASFQVRDAMETILMLPVITFNVLEQMLNSGFLVSLIPEYAGIINRIQYDAYHLYPVDRHMLRTVQNLKLFGSPENPEPDELSAQLYHGLKRKRLLLLAALLHDIGKGQGERHSLSGAKIAEAVMRRMGYEPRDIDTVRFLIENHLLLMKIATRRDINDEETAIVCARQIKDPRRLKMLYLLTVADSRATGPKAWNQWTASLLRDFFLKVLGILEKGEFATVSAVNRIDKKRAAVLLKSGQDFQGIDVGAVFDRMSPRYVLSTSAEDIITHIHLYKRLGQETFVWDIRHDDTRNSRMVTVCAKDRPGLFSKIAGVFTLNQINILDAQANTWKNGIALDIFTVEPPPDQLFEEERWQRVKNHLCSVLTGELDLAARLTQTTAFEKKDGITVSCRPNRVVVDNDSSSFFTIIEVFACDFKGLLFRITSVISRLGLNIAVAKVATKVDQVVDVFYVRDESELKIKDTEFIEKIKSEILSVLPSAKPD
ncbi:MAG: [protein-PII] uridylyltransferase [Desulfobacteraceae bacterium]|nr:MAG: [protein-PII] uridylyltransferase [Desulfobacteraceae bacterium]